MLVIQDVFQGEMLAALDITTVAVDLAASDGPFWDWPAYPEPFAPILDNGSDLRTYLIVDVNARKRIKGVFDLGTLDPEIPVQCLFLNDAAAVDIAPWLIDLSTPGRSRDRFLHDFFDTQWGHGTGIFLRNALPFQRVFDHLRTLLKVRSGKDDNGLVFFRFWDPAIAVVYFNHLRHRADRIAQILTTRTDDLITLAAEDGPDRLMVFAPRAVEPGLPRKPLQIDATDHAAFDRLALRSLAIELTDWLVRDYPERNDLKDSRQQTAFGRHVVRYGMKSGFTLKNEYAYLAHMMLHFGAWFAGQGMFPKSDAILATRRARQHRLLMDAFVADWSASRLPLLKRHRASALKAVTEIPDAPRIAPDALRRWVETHFGGDPVPIRRLFDAVAGILIAPVWRRKTGQQSAFYRFSLGSGFMMILVGIG